MSCLYYFNAADVVRSKSVHLHGIEKFSTFFKLFPSASLPIDRTGSFSLPLATTSLFPLPSLRPFSKTYETICDERAVELLARAEKLDCSLYVFWSGGIDSTLVLVSLLKNATPEQRERLVVLMSEESIIENPNFYRDHIHGVLRRESSHVFPYLLGTNNFFVNGEHNDQLFGAELCGQFMNHYGEAVIHKRYARNLFVSFFTHKVGDANLAVWYVDLLEGLAERAPIGLSTNHDIIWWFNFVAHWQSVFMRTLLYTAERNKDLISKEYITSRYAPFYSTDDFQLWSMNNLDKKIKDTWKTYKWPAKDIIYDYTKDAEYRDNKTKQGSLFLILYHQEPFNYIDDSFRLMRTCNIEEYYNPQNDFL
jgi:hypothetical protein